MSSYELPEGTHERLRDGFKLLGIEPEQYPEYSDPTSFATNFEICTAYKDFSIQSDFCSKCGDAANAKLECSPS